MSSITYDGHSFGDYVSAELAEPVAQVVAPETAKVPGRPGRVLLSADVEPLELKIRLFLDAPDVLTSAQRSEVRRTLRSWLLNTDGSVRKVPGEPDLEWRDVICAGVSDWSSLFSEGSATVTFLALDPIAYGRHLVSVMGRFRVTGGQPTWPEFLFVAEEGATAVGVRDNVSGASLRIERVFSGGERVSVDCARQTVRLNGADIASCLTLGSDFFQLVPGYADLTFTGCSKHNTWFWERWA